MKLLEGKEENMDPELLIARHSRATSAFSSGSSTRLGTELLIDTSTEDVGTLDSLSPDTTIASIQSIKTMKSFPSPILSRLLDKIKKFYYKITKIMTPPLATSILSLVIAVIPPLQLFLENYTPPLKMAIVSAGQCSIPLTLVVLGAYFYVPPSTDGDKDILIRVEEDTDSDLVSIDSLELRVGQQSSLRKVWEKVALSGESRAIVVTTLSRMFLVPALVIPLIYLSTVTGWHNVFEECVLFLLFLFIELTFVSFSPAFTVSIILLASSPPALTLAQVGHLSHLPAYNVLQNIFRSHQNQEATHSKDSSARRSFGRIVYSPLQLLSFMFLWLFGYLDDTRLTV